MSGKAADKIRAGLEDAIAFSQGDESRAVIHTTTEKMPDHDPRALLGFALIAKREGDADTARVLHAAAAEIERLRDELARVNNEFGSATPDWPEPWKRVADLKQLAGDRWRDNERLREALRFYADEKNYRLNGELSPECSQFTGPDKARAALASR